MRKKLKLIYRAVIFFASFPFALFYLCLRNIPNVNYKNVAISISRIPGELGITARQIFYRKTLAKCGQNLRVHFGAFIVYPEVEIGDNCTIEEFSIVSLCKIEDNVIVAARVSIMSGGNHHEVDDLDLMFTESLLPLKTVYIGSNVWIGTHAVIMNDISYGTVVAAGAVVTKVFDKNTIIGGVPADIIRPRGRK